MNTHSLSGVVSADIGCASGSAGSTAHSFRVLWKLLRRRKDGTLGSLFIDRKRVLPHSQLLRSRRCRTKGYQYRPGWHCMQKPHAPHLSMKNRVWARVLVRDDQILATCQQPESQGGLWVLCRKMTILNVPATFKLCHRVCPPSWSGDDRA
jgi:hypothetical protein